MAKKASAKGGKKSVKPAKTAAARAPRRAASGAGAKPKYDQAGAPWWKQFLPG
jgi:hypothetical protein